MSAFNLRASLSQMPKIYLFIPGLYKQQQFISDQYFEVPIQKLILCELLHVLWIQVAEKKSKCKMQGLRRHFWLSLFSYNIDHICGDGGVNPSAATWCRKGQSEGNMMLYIQLKLVDDSLSACSAWPCCFTNLRPKHILCPLNWNTLLCNFVTGVVLC